MNELWTCVGTPYEVHEDMSNHSSGSIFMNIDTLNIKSSKKKITQNHPLKQSYYG